MTIDENLISRLENLARLELSREERQQLLGDMNNIIQMVEKLQKLNTEEVEPLVYINEEVNVLRNDDIKNQIAQKTALKNAPEKTEVYFKVPKVIDIN